MFWLYLKVDLEKIRREGALREAKMGGLSKVGYPSDPGSCNSSLPTCKGDHIASQQDTSSCLFDCLYQLALSFLCYYVFLDYFSV